MAIATTSVEGIHAQLSADSVVDVRPILPRSVENAWERTELIRTNLYLLIERLCARLSIQALILQSHPYVHPAWVKFESWTPTSEPGMTARAAMTITISTTPYCESEALYKVEWEKHGQKGVVDQLYRFDETQVESMLNILAAPPKTGLVTRQVKPILEAVQIRQQWYEFWKPTNKIVAVRREWLPLLCILALVAGVVLLVVGMQEPSWGASPFASDSVLDGFETTPVAFPGTSEFTEPTAVSSRLQSSALDSTDRRQEDGRFYEMRTIQAPGGTPVTITMQSTEFDTYLVVGRFTGGTFTTLQTNDDADDTTTNSRLEFVPPSTGEYVVLFSSLDAGRTGTYSYTTP